MTKKQIGEARELAMNNDLVGVDCSALHGLYLPECYKWGKRYPEGDYFTDDKTDAQQTFDSLPKSNQPRFING